MRPQMLPATLVGGAALVHAAAAGTHAADPALVRLFAATSVVQAVVAGFLLARPCRRSLLVTAGLGVLTSGAWLVSRTYGLPVIDTEDVGLQDGVAAGLALTSAAVAFAAAGLPSLRTLAASPALAALAVVPAVFGVAAPHEHGGAGAEGHDRSETTTAAPLFAGADLTGVDRAQREAAEELITETRSAVAVRFTDEASVEAAGYRTIGDGRRAGQPFEHFVHLGHMTDGAELDPDRIESLVFEILPDGSRKLASAMYILEPGDTMADVPDIAGSLTTWHDHQNLCWDPAGRIVTGILVDGTCIPRGVFRPTPPMLHVWLRPHPCGPFAGIEGSHGAGCTHGH